MFCHQKNGPFSWSNLLISPYPHHCHWCYNHHWPCHLAPLNAVHSLRPLMVLDHHHSREYYWDQREVHLLRQPDMTNLSLIIRAVGDGNIHVLLIIWYWYIIEAGLRIITLTSSMLRINWTVTKSTGIFSHVYRSSTIVYLNYLKWWWEVSSWRET